MGFYLLDHPNPHGPHFYAAQARKLAAVVHITAGLQDLDGGGDVSAESTAQYAATTAVEVSWHGGSDTNSYLYLLPPRYVAWHVVDYNTACYGWEISKSATDWRVMPEWWVEATLRQAANGLRPVLRELGIPIRKATKAELDHAIATGGDPVGLISHAELQRSNRTDPGWVGNVDTFPWDRFLRLLRGEQEDTLFWKDRLTVSRGGKQWTDPADVVLTSLLNHVLDLKDRLLGRDANNRDLLDLVRQVRIELSELSTREQDLVRAEVADLRDAFDDLAKSVAEREGLSADQARAVILGALAEGVVDVNVTVQRKDIA